MLISIDHGNKQVKTIHHAPFTSGLVCSEVQPFGGETLTYQGRYYTLTDQRIPYRRDKTEDERFFVLTLFAIAYELEAASFYGAGPVRVQLAVGLPPAHYGAQQKRFTEYFLNRGTVSFTLHDRQYEILIDEVSCYPQSYAAAITVFQTLQNSPRALIIDIGGFTADYLLLRNGEGDLSVCDSLENGVILLYNRVKSRVAAEQAVGLCCSGSRSKRRTRCASRFSLRTSLQTGEAINCSIRRNGWAGIMDAKKDPGKFTIRFCISDPRQMKAVDELNAQGRLKAQFLTNAILHYVEGTATLPPQEELESILERLMKRMLDDRADMSAKPTEKIDSSEPFSADDLATIAGTLQAFRR